MAMRPSRPCSVPGCSQITRSKYAQCKEHQARADRKKPATVKNVYDSAWAKISREYRQRYPWCQWPGCARPAAQTDHIDGDATNHADDNLRGYCAYHHAVRTSRDQPGGSVVESAR